MGILSALRKFGLFTNRKRVQHKPQENNQNISVASIISVASKELEQKLFISSNIAAREAKRTYIHNAKADNKHFFSKKKTQYLKWKKWKKRAR